MPIAWVPPELFDEGASATLKAVMTDMKKVVRNLKSDAQQGIVMPQDFDPETKQPRYKLELMSAPGTRVIDTGKVIARYAQQIAMTVMADFIMLGHEAVGSFALSSSKTHMFALALGAWLDIIAAVINEQAIPTLLLLNGRSLETRPLLQHADIESKDLGELATYLQTLAAAGATIFPDDDLERHLKELAGLPVTTKVEGEDEEEEPDEPEDDADEESASIED